MMKLKLLQKGSFFTIKDISDPKESQVYIKGSYDRESKVYRCVKFSDINEERFFKGEKMIYTEFTF